MRYLIFHNTTSMTWIIALIVNVWIKTYLVKIQDKRIVCSASKLWNKHATVTGHTPPGTGVIVAHKAANHFRSASPHALPSFIQYPTSTIIFLANEVHPKSSGVSNHTTPVAETIISLLRQLNFKNSSEVELFVVITVAQRRIASRTKGFHIKLLCQIISTLLPFISPTA